MSINAGLFSSRTDEWATPPEFFAELDREFHFDLDPCSTDDNAKCQRHFTAADDGLLQDWNGRVYMNPPYGKDIGMWIRKAYAEFTSGNAELVVMLLPARTDTKWFHDYLYGIAELRFVKGRLKFGNSANSAPFPSLVAIYRR
jgi:site-specific DNA-methyltransferase (adenine-specific)